MLGSERSNEKAKLEDYILAGAGAQIGRIARLSEIVRCHQHHGKADTSGFFAKFRDDCSTLVGSLMEDDRLEADP